MALENDRSPQVRSKSYAKCVVAAILPTIAALAGGCRASAKVAHGQSETAPSAVANQVDRTTKKCASSGGWVVLHQETFDGPLPVRSWINDVRSHEDAYDDNGVYFQRRGISAPPAHRARATFGAQQWLTMDSYSRTEKDPSLLARIVPDPAGGSNRVLRVTSPEHTDATVVRPTRPLPNRICLAGRSMWSISHLNCELVRLGLSMGPRLGQETWRDATFRLRAHRRSRTSVGRGFEGDCGIARGECTASQGA